MAENMIVASILISSVTAIVICKWFGFRYLQIVDNHIEKSMQDILNAVREVINKQK